MAREGEVDDVLELRSVRKVSVRCGQDEGAEHKCTGRMEFLQLGTQPPPPICFYLEVYDQRRQSVS